MQFLIKLFCFFLALVSSLTSTVGPARKDAFTPGTFPEIGIEEKAADAVRIMSFNIRSADVNGTSASLRRQIALEEICRVAPDSLGVQEATELWMLHLRTLPQYGIVGEGRDGGVRGEHNPILYNKETWRLEDSGTFWLSETPDKPSLGWDAACPRICTWAALKNKKTGETYVHVNTHFDHVGETAVAEGAKMVADFIRTRFAGKHVVFTADMNAGPDSEAYRIMTALLQDTRLTAPDSKSYGTFHDGKPDVYTDWILDYILCGKTVTPLVFRTVTEGVNGRLVSDHFPLYADVRF